ncbi:MAG: 3-hydroxyacyl-CoA dehydrogenase family protein, partial [Ktedonobacterales bacterium]|nr:3-hydroxyacyl-CoA dehydrogenase family protein [Ktedonobacterales bacterium]
MSYTIQRAAVIGAGIMGAGIAALLANVGIPVTLLDIVPPEAQESENRAARNRITQGGLDRAIKAKPASAFFSPRNVRLVTVGNVADDFERLREADWIVEAVIEDLETKRALYSRIEGVRKSDALISSNTSGLPAEMLLAGRGADFRRHFLVTHFFNPVRFLKLLELVPGPETDPEVMRYMGAFATERLGKGVVYCKDRPNFIGNRIGSYGFAATIHRMVNEGYRIEEVDALLGPAMGRPRSAAFRTADIAGIDTLLHVADNLYENLPDDP